MNETGATAYPHPQKPKKRLNKWYFFSPLIALAVAIVFSIPQMIRMNEPIKEANTHLTSFLDDLIAGDTDKAYRRIEKFTTKEYFQDQWVKVLRPLVEGASTYRTHDYQAVEGIVHGQKAVIFYATFLLDNGHSIYLETALDSDSLQVLNFYYRDVSDFMDRTARSVRQTEGWFISVSYVLSFFRINMLIDCFRMVSKRKWLWLAFILFCFGMTVTVGDGTNLLIFPSLFDGWHVTTQPATVSVITTVTFPIGAVVYLIRRKKLIAPPEEIYTPVFLTEDRNASVNPSDSSDSDTSNDNPHVPTVSPEVPQSPFSVDDDTYTL